MAAPARPGVGAADALRVTFCGRGRPARRRSCRTIRRATLDLNSTPPRELLLTPAIGSEPTPFKVVGRWNRFATLFRHKDSYVDLTGTAKIRWTVKTSGFHVVRPAVKLADGTMLVGETAAASVPMLVQSEVPVGAIRWIKLDPKRLVTMGLQGAPFNQIWVPNVDLSRVDEVGFVDLMPGSGHGTGGYTTLRFQVYCGRARSATTSTVAGVTCIDDRINDDRISGSMHNRYPVIVHSIIDSAS